MVYGSSAKRYYVSHCGRTRILHGFFSSSLNIYAMDLSSLSIYSYLGFPIVEERRFSRGCRYNQSHSCFSLQKELRGKRISEGSKKR